MKKRLILVTSLISTYAHSHPGHDHSHWASDGVHALTLVAIFAIVGVSAIAIRKNWKNMEDK